MRNFLKRTIVCLTAVALALPTWLIGDFLNPTYAKAEGTDSPYKGQVFINEIYADGTAEWIELRNTTRKSITFQNWLVEDEPTESGTIHNKTISGTLPAGGVLVFEGNFYLNDTGDTAYLLDDNGSFVDGINFTEDFGQKSLGRMDDSSDTLNQFTLPTKGWFNSQNLSIASVVSGLETAGITTNLASFTDLNHVDGLFFEKQGVGRLVFDQQELNLNNIFYSPVSSALILQKVI